MKTLVRYFGLLILLVLPATVPAQWTLPNTGCSVHYAYDDAGNRTARYWYCWAGAGYPVEDGEAANADHQAESFAKKVDDRVLEPLELDLYPNPASDGVTVTVSGPVDQVTYDIYDSNGRSVLHGKMHGGRFDISTTAVPSGYYNLCLVRGQEMLVRSFVVEH